MQAPLIAANWKMHGDRPRLKSWAAALAAARPEGVEIILLPPFVLLPHVEALTPSFAWGGQTLAAEAEGAYTGEVSGDMLAECGCRYVLTGHSERRRLWGEDDASVASQFCRALDAGLQPILCLGESRAEREAGQTLAVVERQLQAVLQSLGERTLSGAVLAYEPVWAIGTGLTAEPAEAALVHAHLRLLWRSHAGGESSPRILYGGSVTPGNAAALASEAEIDGVLVGGASLQAESFLAICNAFPQGGTVPAAR